MDPVIIIINVAALGIIFYLFRLSRKRKKLEASSTTDKRLETIPKDEIRLENVQVGGVVHVSLMEDSYEDYDLVITQKNSYRSGSDFWYELVGDNARAQVALEFELTDSLLITIQMERLKLQDLPISRSDLDQIDQNESGSFDFDEKNFSFTDSGEASFYKNCNDKQAEDFYYWEFKTTDGKYIVSCEQWDDGSIDVTYSKAIPQSSIEVYSLKG
ncbi:DUF4178 domain-containing protein [bacterium]|nr:DUF4178 domain-containing protein [bacterium]